ncbi:MAG: hypothetical protein V1738_03265 [Patescibacteria group bacterium]
MEKNVLTANEEHLICETLLAAGLSADSMRSLINDAELASQFILTLQRVVNEKNKLEADQKKSKADKTEKKQVDFEDLGTYFF